MEREEKDDFYSHLSITMQWRINPNHGHFQNFTRISKSG